jgi:hypothetical protein
VPGETAETRVVDKVPHLTAEEQQAADMFLQNGLSTCRKDLERMLGASRRFLEKLPPVSALELLHTYEQKFATLVQEVRADTEENRCEALLFVH